MPRGDRRAVAAIGAAAVVACVALLTLALSLKADGPRTGATSASGHPSSAAASGSTRQATAPASSAAPQPASPSPAASWGGPQGFWLGTDSDEVDTPGSGPYQEPAVGGAYGGYIGMIGNWANWQRCGGQVVWSAADSSSARANYVTYHSGIGVAGYWFMAGPGVDPNYDGTVGEATAWGAAQAAQVLAELPQEPTPVNYPVIFMDVEIPGDAPSFTPAPDNGWTAVYTSACSSQVRQNYVLPSLNRADFDGFATYLTSHSAYKAGVYSAPSIWTTIFGTNPADADIPDTYEWTYESETSSLIPPPDGWCVSGTGTCAQFFGGQTSSSPYALMWQWSGGGGVRNGYGDFDQIDASRTP